MSLIYSWLSNKDVLKKTINMRRSGLEYQQIQHILKEEHDVTASTEMIRGAYNRHKDTFPIELEKEELPKSVDDAIALVQKSIEGVFESSNQKVERITFSIELK